MRSRAGSVPSRWPSILTGVVRSPPVVSAAVSLDHRKNPRAALRDDFGGRFLLKEDAAGRQVKRGLSTRRTNLLSASPGTTAGKALSAALFVDQLELLNTQVRAITKRNRERPYKVERISGLAQPAPPAQDVALHRVQSILGDRARPPTPA